MTKYKIAFIYIADGNIAISIFVGQVVEINGHECACIKGSKADYPDYKEILFEQFGSIYIRLDKCDRLIPNCNYITNTKSRFINIGW